MPRPSTQPSSLGRIWLPIAALAAISAAAFAIAQQAMTAQASAPADAAPPPLPVSVATVAESDATLWDEFSGRLEAVERVEIRSRVAGAVLATHFREGALVAKGALLVSIDPAPYEAEVARAEAQASAAQARLSHASGEFARSQRLWQDKAIAQRELDDRQNALREAEANLQAARAQVQARQLDVRLEHRQCEARGFLQARLVLVDAESLASLRLHGDRADDQERADGQRHQQLDHREAALFEVLHSSTIAL